MEIDLSTKTYVVTGATSGIGLAVAEELLSGGSAMIGVGRSPQRCRETEQRLQQKYPAAQVSYLVADLAEQREVKLLAEQIRDMLSSRGTNTLNGLVNNAGIFTYWFTQTSDGIEMQWAVNHLAPFLLTHELLPLLEQTPLSRVVTVSSGSHYGGRLNWEDPQLRHHYSGLQAYYNTKLCNILFTTELNHRLGEGSNVHAFAADPGLVKTDMGLKGTPLLAAWVWKLRRSGGTPPEVPAKGIVYLLTEPSIQQSKDVYWKDSRPKTSSPKAVDGSMASRLWVLSEKMCGMSEDEQHE
jgi:NAD(P)-dependent dehydrogenase (short-subunit alcohol dehydrogenase family)